MKGLLQHLNRNTLLKAKKKIKRYKAQVKEVEEERAMRDNEIEQLKTTVQTLRREMAEEAERGTDC